MRAFVKTNGGTFPNLNFYLAWEAFNQMGYSVTCFEEKDIPNLDITPATPVFAGVKIFRDIIDKLGVDYPPFDCYPAVLNPYYGRNLRQSTLGEEKAKFHKDGVRVFVKPVLPKQFIGAVWDSILNLIPIANAPDDAKVWVCEPLEFLSEYRVYVNDGEILGVKHYFGDWDIHPQKRFIEEVVKNYKGAPISYGVDIAVVKRDRYYEDVVIEVNDGCNLGNYGLDSIHYGEMIVDRWFEIVGEKNGKEALRKSMVNEMKQEAGMNEEVDRFIENMTSKIKKVPYIDELTGDYNFRFAKMDYDIGIPEVTLNIGSKPLVTGYMKYQIGEFKIDRDEYWLLTDAERQALHDKHNSGSKAIPFHPMFAEKYGKNPNGPF